MFDICTIFLNDRVFLWLKDVGVATPSHISSTTNIYEKSSVEVLEDFFVKLMLRGQGLDSYLFMVWRISYGFVAKWSSLKRLFL